MRFQKTATNNLTSSNHHFKAWSKAVLLLGLTSRVINRQVNWEITTISNQVPLLMTAAVNLMSSTAKILNSVFKRPKKRKRLSSLLKVPWSAQDWLSPKLPTYGRWKWLNFACTISPISICRWKSRSWSSTTGKWQLIKHSMMETSRAPHVRQWNLQDVSWARNGRWAKATRRKELQSKLNMKKTMIRS